jgi:trehalose/maltose hydrolase-like predicted phosphorylase
VNKKLCEPNRKQKQNKKKKKTADRPTLNNGYLGFRIDEGHSKM